MTHHLSGQLAPTPPFDFAQSIGFLEGFTPTQNEQTIADLTLTKAVFVEGVIVFRLTATGSVEEPKIDYTLWSDAPVSATVQHAAEDRIRFFLSLDDDLRPFYAIGAQDSVFAPIIKQRYGYHQVKFLTPFENACWAVLTQRTPMAVARKLKQTLVEQFGGNLEVDGQRYWAFPEPARIAAVAPEQLTALVGNERRAAYLHAVAVAWSSVDETWLRTAPSGDVLAWLQAIKGIGAWSSEFIALRGLGRMDVLPSNEARLMEMATRLYGPSVNDSDAFAGIVARYRPWQGYWAHYIRVGGD